MTRDARGASRARKYPLLEGTIREHLEEARLDSTQDRYCDVRAETLLMSSDWPSAQSTNATLATVLPRARVQRFRGLDHLAPERAPARISESLVAFFG